MLEKIVKYRNMLPKLQNHYKCAKICAINSWYFLRGSLKLLPSLH